MRFVFWFRRRWSWSKPQRPTSPTVAERLSIYKARG